MRRVKGGGFGGGTGTGEVDASAGEEYLRSLGIANY